MTFTESLLARARSAPKKIVFPESTEEKILLAARRVCDDRIAEPILIGNKDAIAARAAELGISLKGFSFVDHQDESIKNALIASYLSTSDELSEKALNRKFRDPLNFAAAMVKVGQADCLAAGIAHTTGEVVLAAQVFIGMQKGISTVSSLGIAEFPNWTGPQGHFLVLTDCAVQPRPTSEELADIAVASADTVRCLLNWEPRVAMLSFSTKGSSTHEDVETVAKAVELARQKCPGLLVDGEFQLDAAIIPEAAAKKVKGESPVAGRANILVFPNLGAGNIGVKMTQIFAGAVAYGPILQGFAKPVTDFSRSAPVEEMVGNLVMLVVRAQGLD